MVKPGHPDKVTAGLKEKGIPYQHFDQVESDPSQDNTKKCFAQVMSFSPTLSFQPLPAESRQDEIKRLYPQS